MISVPARVEKVETVKHRDGTVSLSAVVSSDGDSERILLTPAGYAWAESVLDRRATVVWTLAEEHPT